MAKLTEEEKKVKEEAKAIKAEERAKKKLEKEANKPPKHQAKLDRARSKLPELAPVAQEMFDTLVQDYTPEHLEGLSAHLAFHVRQQQTHAAVQTELKVGQTVRIKSGNQKHLGKVGVVSSSQRIRCYVTIPNVDKDVYLFTSDVEPVAANDVAETVEVVNDPAVVAEQEEVAVAV